MDFLDVKQIINRENEITEAIPKILESIKGMDYDIALSALHQTMMYIEDQRRANRYCAENAPRH